MILLLSTSDNKQDIMEYLLHFMKFVQKILTKLPKLIAHIHFAQHFTGTCLVKLMLNICRASKKICSLHMLSKHSM